MAQVPFILLAANQGNVNPVKTTFLSLLASVFVASAGCNGMDRESRETSVSLITFPGPKEHAMLEVLKAPTGKVLAFAGIEDKEVDAHGVLQYDAKLGRYRASGAVLPLAKSWDVSRLYIYRSGELDETIELTTDDPEEEAKRYVAGLVSL